MPLARIVTRAVEESQELAADLRGRGFDVEIVLPADVLTTRADVELRLEECTPEEALIRAGVLPETNDMAVFIAPGAITARRERQSAPLKIRFPGQSKWYEPFSDSEGARAYGANPPFANMQLEEESARDIAVPGNGSDTPRISIVPEPHAAQTSHARVDQQDEPLFATGMASAARAVPNFVPHDPSITKPMPIAQVPNIKQPIVAKAAANKRIESELDRLPAPMRTTPIRTMPVAATRRMRIPALSWRGRWKVSKTSAGVAGVALLVVVIGVWVLRRAPMPSEYGSSASDVHQSVPFTDSKGTTPSAAKRPATVQPEASRPVESNSPSLVPQAAAAVAPPSSTKRTNNQKRPTSPRRTTNESDVVASDTVTRFPAHTPKAQAKPKPDTAKHANDGIKRYSDLD
jgi:negative regulator of sigma E activity